jgi:hypothetical protein
MSCCPAGSHGWHPGAGGKGGVVQIGGEGGLPVYVSGKQTKEAVVDVYDIFGLDGGRTQGFADDLAEKGDFLVVVPDFFRYGLTHHPFLHLHPFPLLTSSN